VSADFEIRNVKPIEVDSIDIGGHDSAVDPDSLGKPHSHRSAACADFKTTPAGLNEGTPLTRKRIEDFFKEVESLILGLLASRCSEAIYWFGCMDVLAVCSILMFRHAGYRNPPPAGLSILPTWLRKALNCPGWDIRFALSYILASADRSPFRILDSLR
jgi:hypothetical protein